MLNDGVQVESVRVHSRTLMQLGGGFKAGGESQVVGADDAIDGLQQGGFEDGGQLAHVSRPTVLEQTGQSAGSHEDGALLVAGANAVQQGLCQGGDVFAALAQGWDAKADGGEAEGQIGQHQALGGHLAQRGLGGGQQDGASLRTVLEGFKYTQQQTLTGRGEQVHTIQIGETRQGGRIGVGNQPFAGIAPLKAATGQRGAAEEIVCQGLLACAVFTLDGGQLHIGRGHLSLHQQFTPCGADSHGLHFRRRLDTHKGEAGDGRLVLSNALHGYQRASPP